MFREIVDLARECDYDFRVRACPEDGLRHLWEEWVPYYRGKWAIARYLQPTRILEIGVRYGYSALAFLDACPSSDYTGIDLDSDLYGGAKDASHWARTHAGEYKANFIIADTQKLDRFPGGDYDLIHIDGQQDQAGFVRDLELAIGQGRYILVDGYFWTRDNFLSASEFLFRNRDLIEFYGVIPGYAGDLLIARKESAAAPSKQMDSSSQIRDAYTSHYYLRDCGGYDSFKRTQGLRLEDPRLQAVMQLTSLAEGGRALDLGCGRGELSIALAKRGFDTTAIDYSPDAIALAQSTKIASGDPSLKVAFLCGDLNEVPLEGTYDIAVAADVIEHLAPGELDKLYDRVAAHLSPDGLFVIHTFPNAWYYRYEHARKLKIARSVGAYLPLDPRSRYEKLMHINEQSPAVLRQQLRRYFPHALVWFCEHDAGDPYENLRRKFSIREMMQAGDLFAIASHQPINPTTLGRMFTMDPATSLAKGDLRIEIPSAPATVEAGASFTVALTVFNSSDLSLSSYPPNPVHLCYHWTDPVTSQVVVFDGARTLLEPALPGKSTQHYNLFVRAPLKPRTYRLRATLVQEEVQWLDLPPVEVSCDVTITVR